MFRLQAAWGSVKQIQGAEIMEGLNKYTMEKRRILFKCVKEIRENVEFAKVFYNRLVSY